MALKVWLPLDGNLRNLGTSNYEISTFRGAETYNNNGKIGKCFYSNGVNTLKIINIIPDIYNYSAYSLSAWCYVEAQNTTHTGSAIISAGNWNNQLLNLSISDWSSDHYTKLRISGTSWRRTYNYNFYKNIWYHIVVCDDGQHTYGYVNGTLIGDTASSFLPTTIEGNDMCIGGATYYSGMQFFGKINDVRIYDHCLSVTEVREIAMGLVLHYKLDDPYIEGTTNLFTENPCKNGSLASHGSFIENGKGVKIDWTSNAGDTYWYLNLKEQNLIEGETYTLSFQCSGLSNTTVAFRWCNLTNYTIYLKNGFNSYTFNMPSKNITNPFFDDVNRDTTLSNLQLWNFQLEKKDHVTPYTSNSRESNNIIQDSSGYGHNGTINGVLTTSSDTTKYTTSTVFNGSSYVTIPNIFENNVLLSEFTWTGWVKRNYTDTNEHGVYNGIAYIRFRSYNNKNFSPFISWYHSTTSESKTNSWTTGSSLPENTWTHIAFTFKNGILKYYCNGNYISTNNRSNTGQYIKTNYGTTLGSYGTSNYWIGNLSDVRVYTTQLLDTDIKQLYNVGMKVDNLQNVHTFELNENGSNKLTRTGILKDYAIEPYKTLSDGSYWKLMLFHYVDGGNNLFTSSNATYNNGFGLYSRLRDIANYTYDSKYEYYVIQDGKEFRWTQTSSPTAASITGLTTVSGYNNPVNGLAKSSSLTQTYIGYNTWWGACGCWTSYSTGGKTGIPGFGSHDGNGICTNYLALYTRIEKSKTEIANENIYAENLIEF